MVIERVFFQSNFAENTSDMKLIYTILIVGAATLLLITSSMFTDLLAWQIHPIVFLNTMAKHQLFALIVAMLVTISVLILNPSSFKFLSIGQITTIAEKEKWLGINGRSSWKKNGLQLLFFVSLPTATFMFLAVKYTDSMHNFQWSFIPLVLFFSFINSLTEELIFRFGIVGGLVGQYSARIILIISAVLFGLPHYVGFPSGFIGVVMSGILGYILCKATIETKGLSIAWTIHFVQDIIIFTALMMMNVRL